MDKKETAYMHKSIDLGWNKSPLNQGKVHIGVYSIDVKLIGYPADEDMFRNCISKMVLSTTGSPINHVPNKELAEELFYGGLQTGLEAFTFIFEISGISRQLTHELVRTRKAVFHQQSMRHTDMGNNFNVRCPMEIAKNDEAWTIWLEAIQAARLAYARLKELDITYQDCRTVCPIGIETYIVASYPISEFLNTYAYRACRMFLPEIQYVFGQMKKCIIEKFPWMEKFIKVSCEKTKRCMYQGWEDTTKDCEFEWAGDRVFKPNIDLIGLKGKAYETMKDGNKPNG